MYLCVIIQQVVWSKLYDQFPNFAKNLHKALLTLHYASVDEYSSEVSIYFCCHTDNHLIPQKGTGRSSTEGRIWIKVNNLFLGIGRCVLCGLILRYVCVFKIREIRKLNGHYEEKAHLLRTWDIHNQLMGWSLQGSSVSDTLINHFKIHGCVSNTFLCFLRPRWWRNGEPVVSEQLCP